MVYRASRPREPKRGRLRQVSTFEIKLRRHKNKYRIWRRAVKRLVTQQAPRVAPVTV